MNLVNVTFFENCFDNNAGNIHHLEWEDFRDEYLSDHLIVDDKNTYMFNGIGFCNDLEEEFTRRCAANAVWITMAVLDFDGGMTIEEAKERFKGYEYAGYTTYSHLTAKKSFAECFRIVMPLSQIYPVSGFNERIKALKEWAGAVDESTTDRSRGFYIPSCSSEMEGKAYSWHNAGKRLRMLDFAVEEVVINNTGEGKAIEDDKMKQTIKDKLMNIFLGNEPEWIKTMWAMKGAGYSEQDFIDVTVQGQLMRQKSVKNCQDRWKKSTGNTGSTGYLVNLIRRYSEPEFLMKKSKRAVDPLLEQIKKGV